MEIRSRWHVTLCDHFTTPTVTDWLHESTVWERKNSAPASCLSALRRCVSFYYDLLVVLLSSLTQKSKIIWHLVTNNLVWMPKRTFMLIIPSSTCISVTLITMKSSQEGTMGICTMGNNFKKVIKYMNQTLEMLQGTKSNEYFHWT